MLMPNATSVGHGSGCIEMGQRFTWSLHRNSKRPFKVFALLAIGLLFGVAFAGAVTTALLYLLPGSVWG